MVTRARGRGRVRYSDNNVYKTGLNWHNGILVPWFGSCDFRVKAEMNNYSRHSSP